MADIVQLSSFVASKCSSEFVKQYISRLRTEIEVLSYLADAIAKSKYRLPKMYHPDAKTYSVGNKKLTVIFHIEDEYVLVDKILPSSMITY